MTPDHAPIAFLRNVPIRRIIRALEHEGFRFVERHGSFITTVQAIPSRRM